MNEWSCPNRPRDSYSANWNCPSPALNARLEGGVVSPQPGIVPSDIHTQFAFGPNYLLVPRSRLPAGPCLKVAQPKQKSRQAYILQEGVRLVQAVGSTFVKPVHAAGPREHTLD